MPTQVRRPCLGRPLGLCLVAAGLFWTASADLSLRWAGAESFWEGLWAPPSDTCLFLGRLLVVLLLVGLGWLLQRRRAAAVSREVLGRALEAAPQPVVLLDPAGRVTFVNRAFTRVFGWRASDLLGRHLVLGGQGDWSDHGAPELERLASGETLSNLESRRVTRWGQVVDVAISAAAVPDGRGGVAGFVVHLCDITAYKQAERSRAESQTLYHAVFESSPDVITISRLDDGRYLAVNQSFCQTTGYTREEVIGRSSLELRLFVDPADRQELQRRLRREGVVPGMEIRFRTKDGRVLDTLLAARRFRFRGQECLVAVVKDISQSKRLARERAQLEAQLSQAQKLEALGVLAAGVAHDFNNLLQAAGGYLYLLGLERDPRRSAHYRKQIRDILQRGADLVQRLLTFGRKVEPRYRRLDLNQVVRQALALLERTIPKMIAIETRLSPELLPLRGDPAQLEQVLVNLVTNAVDAMGQEGRLLISTSTVELDPEYARRLEAEPGTYLLLVVKDTGCGMDPQTRRRIFEPFFTTKEPGRGSGLGLSAVYGIVRAHGGHVLCESEPGRGTTFWVYLPVSRAAAPEERAEDTSPPPDRGRREAGGETILVVDDEPAILESARVALEQAGYRVLTASSGEQALGLYARRGEEIALVLLDLGMPGMGGLRCLEELRKLSPGIRVVISSGYFAEELVGELRRWGIRDYLRKPYGVDQLLDKVGQALEAEEAAGPGEEV